MVSFSYPNQGPVDTRLPKVGYLTIPWRKRLVRFPMYGIGIGLVFSLWATIVFVVAGPDAQERYEVSLWEIVQVYLTSGAVGGLAVAVVYPLARWIIGAFIVGALGVLPMYFGFSVLMEDDPILRLALSALLAMVVGGSVATGAWLDHHGRAIPRWVALLRFPTWRTVGCLWIVALLCSLAAWYMGLRWEGEWPAVVAIFLFLAPVGLATGITIVAGRDKQR